MLKDIELGNLTAPRNELPEEGEEKPEKVKRPPPWYQTQAFEIKVFVYGMMTYAYVFAMIYLHDPLKDDMLECNASRVLSTFFIFMALTSYYRCSTNLSYPKIPWVPGWLVDSKFKTCKKCKHSWKADRTHHCSQCGRCVAKMDHHCPWINNCVGYANHKSFLFFCFYTSLGTFYYVFLSAVYLFDLLEHFDFSRHSLFFYGTWLVLGTVVFGTGCWMFGLACFHIKYAVNNITGIETLSNYQMSYPCFPKMNPYKKINPYDKGQLANLCDFLGDDYLLWWFPTIMKTYKRAIYFEPIPIVRILEKHEEIHGKFKSTAPLSLNHFDYQGWLKASEEFCNDKTLQFMGQTYEPGKRNDNLFGKILTTTKAKFDFEMEQSAEDPNEIIMKSNCEAPVINPKPEEKQNEQKEERQNEIAELTPKSPAELEEHQKKIQKELDDFFSDENISAHGFQNPIVK